MVISLFWQGELGVNFSNKFNSHFGKITVILENSLNYFIHSIISSIPMCVMSLSVISILHLFFNLLNLQLFFQLLSKLPFSASDFIVLQDSIRVLLLINLILQLYLVNLCAMGIWMLDKSGIHIIQAQAKWQSQNKDNVVTLQPDLWTIER